MNRNIIDWIALILILIGGLNWGLVGIFNFDIIAWIFNASSVVATIVYILVGIAAIWSIIRIKNI